MPSDTSTDFETTDWDRGFDFRPAIGGGSPVLISSPHSGRNLPKGVMNRIHVGHDLLRHLDDGPVDLMMEEARLAGAELIAAAYPRTVIDLNRHHHDLDPLMIVDGKPDNLMTSSKARVGLGVIPSRVMGKSIYSGPLRLADLEDRLNSAYWPYYAKLEELLVARVERYGAALLLDCHSMPDCVARYGGKEVDVTLGDCFGKSCHPDVVQAALSQLKNAGLSVSLNIPYAGGHITQTFGRPREGISALQIEVRRSLFMDEKNHEPHAGLSMMAKVMRDLVDSLGEAAINQKFVHSAA